MTALDALLQDLALYPRWLVALCTIVLAAAVVWLLAKLLKWTLYLAAAVTFGCIVIAVVAWWLA